MAQTADYKLGEFTYGRGWYMIAQSGELGDKPLNLRYFGRDLVLYRGESGTPHLVNAYCPHMGAHIGKNTTSYIVLDGEQVQGESIRCPFHGWRFGPDGECDDIAYCDHRPLPKVSLGTYPVIERAGVLWMWFDEEGNEPLFDLPAFEPYDDPNWARWNIDDLGELEQHPVEIVDNMTDAAHFIPIHGSKDIQVFYNEMDGHVMWQIFSAGHRTLVEEGVGTLDVETWYTGPSILQAKMHGTFPTHMLIAHTPVEDGKIHVWHGLMVQFDHIPSDEDRAMARAYEQESCRAFGQDFEIWQNKRPCLKPMMVKGDGPTNKGRLWYRQFFNPVGQAGEFHARVNGRHVTIDNRTQGDIQAAE